MKKRLFTRVIKCKLMYDTEDRYGTEAIEAELRRRGIELVLEEDDYMPMLRMGDLPKKEK